MVEIDGKSYKVWGQKHHSMLHFKINPGLAINELVFGQRIPKEIYFEQVENTPLMERQYIRCPHCETMHDGRTWSVQNKTAFKNWFGLYCPECGDTIPCTRNYTSWLILALTYLLWFWWIEKWKTSWKASQPKRYQNIQLATITVRNTNWVNAGLLFGIGMFLIMTLGMPVITGTEITIKSIIIAIPIWAIAGFLFAFILKKRMNRLMKTSKT